MKSKYFKITFFVILIAIVAVGFVFLSPSLSVSALTTDEIIASKLEDMGVSDAVSMETTMQADKSNKEYLRCISDSTGFQYSFDSVSGRLIDIRKNMNTQTVAVASDSASSILTDDERRAYVLEHVSSCMQDELIGELEIDSENFSNVNYSYLILEYYNGEETGTSAFVSCTPEGEITVCSFKYGSIFCKKANGDIVLANDTPFISEENAIETAMEFVEEKADEKSGEVLTDSPASELHATEDMHYYEVCIDTQEPDGYIVSYDVWIDVYSGEILFYQFTQ